MAIEEVHISIMTKNNNINHGFDLIAGDKSSRSSQKTGGGRARQKEIAEKRRDVAVFCDIRKCSVRVFC